MSAAQGWLMAGAESGWGDDAEIDLWFYRQRTMILLRRYARASVEMGRLPSLLGRECFRTRLSSYAMTNFEEVVIFVHDMERAIGKLNPLEKKLLAMSIVEDCSQAEVARLLGCPQRTVERFLPEAVDELSRVLLRVGMLEKTPWEPNRENSCQEGKNYEIEVSRCN